MGDCKMILRSLLDPSISKYTGLKYPWQILLFEVEILLKKVEFLLK
jgi:hypothetical protein